MEKWEWAWLAGIYEGEGTLAFVGRNSIQIRIGMTDEDVIDTIQRLFPANPWRRELRNRTKPLYIWQLNDRDKAREFLAGVLPFLHVRRATRVREALERLECNLGAKSKRTHCVNGHPLSGENLYIRPYNGTRSCRICRDRAQRRRTSTSPSPFG